MGEKKAQNNLVETSKCISNYIKYKWTYFCFQPKRNETRFILSTLNNQKTRKKIHETMVYRHWKEAAQDCDPKRRKMSTITPDSCLEAASMLYVTQEEEPKKEPFGPIELESQRLKSEKATVARICGEEDSRGESWTRERAPQICRESP